MAASAPARKNWPTAFSLARTDHYWVGRFVAMACPCEVLVEPAEESVAHEIVGAVARWAWRIEKKFSRYRDDSVVHAINTSRGKVITVDEETSNLLDFAAQLTCLSEGRFDITSGVLRRAWKFDGGSDVPAQQQIDSLMRLVGWHRVRWERPLLCLSVGMEVDFGGIGKEYAVDTAADHAARLAPEVSCLVNFGGDICVRRPRSDGAPWRVGIETVSPGDRTSEIVPLLRGGLATSGDSRRFVINAGKRYSHILDARTGWPVRDAPRSITVAADTCCQAGSLTTLAMLAGPDAKALLESSGNRYWLQ